MFQLDQRLAADCEVVGDLPLCRVLLMNDANFPWLILVPRVAGVTEIIDLDTLQRQQLLQESCAVADVLKQIFNPDKLNVAALGNVVSQLHLHHIARFKADAAWPKPIWGAVPTLPYRVSQAAEIVQQVSAALQKHESQFVKL